MKELAKTLVWSLKICSLKKWQQVQEHNPQHKGGTSSTEGGEVIKKTKGCEM